ncbi:MAG: hypothetical protein ACTSV6_04940 [Candidatus Heimdallarchaeota archaeon]
MDKLYEEFFDPTELFKTEPRYFCYELATELIEKIKESSPEDWYQNKNTIKGILLLLFTWNFAARETKKLDFENVGNVLQECNQELKELECYSIENINDKIDEKIKKVFKKFKKLMGQTGASKALSLLNPKLFVMWDTKIRRRLNRELIKGIDNGETPENYLKFLYGIRKIIEKYKIRDKLSQTASVAKKIDEYHYVRIIMNR